MAPGNALALVVDYLGTYLVRFIHPSALIMKKFTNFKVSRLERKISS